MTALKLTALGRLANAHGTMTPPKWWHDLFREADRLNDQDPDLGLSMLDERIAGMQELRRRWYLIVNNVDDINA